MRLPAIDFIGRFLKHVLPKGFMRIRHYGLLANRTKQEQLGVCRKILDAAPPEPSEPKSLADWLLLWTGEDADRCPQCGHGELVSEEILPTARPARLRVSVDQFW